MRRAEYSVGLDDGKLLTLIDQTYKKYLKKNTVSEVADMLETDAQLIERIYQVIEATQTDDIHKILEALTSD